MIASPDRVYRGLRRRAGGLRDRVRHRLSRRTQEAAPPPRPGHRPDVALERTNLGPELDEAVLRAKRRMRIGADPDYDLVYENFDVLHYVLQAPRVLERPGLDLVQQFLDRGAELERSPDPDFSMGTYLALRPELAGGGDGSPYLEWLRRGRALGEIADPAPRIPEMAHVLGLDPQELLGLVVDRRRDLLRRFRTGRLGEMFAKAAEIEPLIASTVTELARPKLLPLTTPAATGQLSAIYRAQEEAGFRRARLVLVINRPRWGGGRRIEGHITHALAGHLDPAEIVVIYTDASNETPAGRYPAGVREIDFGRIAGDLSPEEAQAALAALIRSFHADAVVNINSRMLYHALRTFGQAMSASERLFLCFFCNELSAMGAWQGWSLGYFYRTFDYAAGVITDSEYLASRLVESYRLTAVQRERLHVFRAPVDPALPLVPAPAADPQRRRQVFWAGRWDRQKRVDLVLEVARRMPDVDFRMWGESVLGDRTRKLPPNVSAEGVYAHISHIPLAEADAWLYTSAWDGVPSQLLEVAMTGIPIVGTEVGGTGELITEADAWPVAADAGADDYVHALRTVLADPAGSRSRAEALRERLVNERAEKAFAARAVDVLLVRDEAEAGER